MKRRTYISMATCSLVGLGGCIERVTQRSSSPPVGLGKVRLYKLVGGKSEITVLVEKDGDVVYERTHTMDGSDNDTLLIVEDWMGEKVPYTVTVSESTTGREDSVSTEDMTDFVSEWGDDECFGIVSNIRRNRISFALGFMEACDDVDITS